MLWALNLGSDWLQKLMMTLFPLLINHLYTWVLPHVRCHKSVPNMRTNFLVPHSWILCSNRTPHICNQMDPGLNRWHHPIPKSVALLQVSIYPDWSQIVDGNWPDIAIGFEWHDHDAISLLFQVSEMTFCLRGQDVPKEDVPVFFLPRVYMHQSKTCSAQDEHKRVLHRSIPKWTTRSENSVLWLGWIRAIPWWHGFSFVVVLFNCSLRSCFTHELTQVNWGLCSNLLFQVAGWDCAMSKKRSLKHVKGVGRVQ